MLEIVQFPCRDDNFGVVIHDAKTSQTAAIDAPELKPILALLDERGWTLTHISRRIITMTMSRPTLTSKPNSA